LGGCHDYIPILKYTSRKKHYKILFFAILPLTLIQFCPPQENLSPSGFYDFLFQVEVKEKRPKFSLCSHIYWLFNLGCRNTFSISIFSQWSIHSFDYICYNQSQNIQGECPLGLSSTLIATIEI